MVEDDLIEARSNGQKVEHLRLSHNARGTEGFVLPRRSNQTCKGPLIPHKMAALFIHL